MTMTKPEILVSKVFKARYHPRSSFFKGNLGNKLGFVRRSLWKARKVLTLGCRWNIGDGSRIKVMNEPWLRGAEEGCFRGLQGQDVYDIIVNNLMLANVKQYDIHKIRYMFTNDVANDIFKVTLVEDMLEDIMVWK